MQQLSILILLLFTGCVVKYEMPKNMPQFTQYTFEVKYKGGKNLLLVSKSANTYYFMYMSALGIPVSKKTLKNGIFKTDGFLPQNENINNFFIKILNFIKLKRKTDIITLKNGNKYEIRQLSLSQ